MKVLLLSIQSSCTCTGPADFVKQSRTAETSGKSVFSLSTSDRSKHFYMAALHLWNPDRISGGYVHSVI